MSRTPTDTLISEQGVTDRRRLTPARLARGMVGAIETIMASQAQTSVSAFLQFCARRCPGGAGGADAGPEPEPGWRFAPRLSGADEDVEESEAEAAFYEAAESIAAFSGAAALSRSGWRPGHDSISPHCDLPDLVCSVCWKLLEKYDAQWSWMVLMLSAMAADLCFSRTALQVSLQGSMRVCSSILVCMGNPARRARDPDARVAPAAQRRAPRRRRSCARWTLCRRTCARSPATSCACARCCTRRPRRPAPCWRPRRRPAPLGPTWQPREGAGAGGEPPERGYPAGMGAARRPGRRARPARRWALRAHWPPVGGLLRASRARNTY